MVDDSLIANLTAHFDNVAQFVQNARKKVLEYDFQAVSDICMNFAFTKLKNVDISSDCYDQH